MSIKSDRWIRRMAREQRMIEPFEPDQARNAIDERSFVDFKGGVCVIPPDSFQRAVQEAAPDRRSPAREEHK